VCKRKKENLSLGMDVFVRDPVIGVHLRLGDALEDFELVKEHLDEALGVHVPKTHVIRHALAITAQFYSNKVGRL
jgi:hypothetical protein